MTFWGVLALIGLGYVLRMAHERPAKHADVDALVRERAKEALRQGMRDV